MVSCTVSLYVCKLQFPLQCERIDIILVKFPFPFPVPFKLCLNRPSRWKPIPLLWDHELLLFLTWIYGQIYYQVAVLHLWAIAWCKAVVWLLPVALTSHFALISNLTVSVSWWFVAIHIGGFPHTGSRSQCHRGDTYWWISRHRILLHK